MKCAFLDRDGTINRDYPDEEWQQINEPVILPGSIQGLKYISQQGYEIIIVTNQYTIGEGIISLDQYNDFTNKLLFKFSENGIKIKDIFYCPHPRYDNCDCCKPKTGLIKQALSKYPNIDISKSFMCGDSSNDMQCAESIGLRFFGINIGMHPISSLQELNEFI